MSRRPNVIVIMADDMGFGDLGCVNGGINDTPHLDRLHQESLRLSQGYAASCVCAPSRAAFLTGRYPTRTGCTCLNDIHGLNRLDLRETTIADLFAAGGYQTGLIGKWHCGRGEAYRPQQRGFTHVEAFHPMGFDYWDWSLDVNGKPRRSKGEYLTDHLADRSVQFVRQHRHEPFFLHLAHYAPHRPLQAPDHLLEKYRARPDLTPGQAVVYAMIESLDQAVGRLLDALQELGLDRHTIVVFTSDNGPDPHRDAGLSPARSNLGLRGGKYSVHEGGIRVPMLVRWPDGMLSGGEEQTMCHGVDLLPTLAAMCRLDLPRELKIDGQNLYPAWQGEPRNVDPLRYWQWNRHLPQRWCNAAVRDGHWKLVYPAMTGYNQLSPANIEMIEGRRPFETTPPSPLDLGPPHRPMLFNLDQDPTECHDLAATHADRVDRLSSALGRWQDETIEDLTRCLGRRVGAEALSQATPCTRPRAAQRSGE